MACRSRRRIGQRCGRTDAVSTTSTQCGRTDAASTTRTDRRHAVRHGTHRDSRSRPTPAHLQRVIALRCRDEQTKLGPRRSRASCPTDRSCERRCCGGALPAPRPASRTGCVNWSLPGRRVVVHSQLAQGPCACCAANHSATRLPTTPADGLVRRHVKPFSSIYEKKPSG